MASFSHAVLNDLMRDLWDKARQPAAGIAVVADGEIVYSRHLSSENGTPSNGEEARLFHIASISKSFNATLIAMLVDEGRLDWDHPVVEYIPDFRLIDDDVSRRCTLRDLICMRTGLPRHDMAWVGRHLSREDLFRGLQHLAPVDGFRSRFHYNNITVTIAGHIVELVTGRTWEDLVADRIFLPLGMTASGCDPSLPTVQPFHESPSGQLVASAFVSASVTAPSGGAIVSSLKDMAKWVAFNLGDGRYGDDRLLSESRLRELQSPMIGIGADQGRLTASGCYGLGWFVDHYNGYRRVSHGGYLHDMNSDLSLFPELGLGIINYCAFGSNAVASFVSQQVFDTIVGTVNRIGVDHALREYSKQAHSLRERVPIAKGDGGTAFTEAALEGRFVHPAYGTIHITRSGERITVHLNEDLRGDFIRNDGNTWIVAETGISMTWPDPFRWPCQIDFTATDEEQSLAGSLRVALEPDAEPIEFQRQV